MGTYINTCTHTSSHMHTLGYLNQHLCAVSLLHSGWNKPCCLHDCSNETEHSVNHSGLKIFLWLINIFKFSKQYFERNLTTVFYFLGNQKSEIWRLLDYFSFQPLWKYNITLRPPAEHGIRCHGVSALMMNDCLELLPFLQTVLLNTTQQLTFMVSKNHLYNNVG